MLARTATRVAVVTGVLMVGVTVAAYLRSRRHTTPRADDSPDSSRGEAHVPECAHLASRYHAELAATADCTADAECTTAPRGRFFMALDGCARATRRTASLAEADRLAKAWLGAGCSDWFEECPAPRDAICRAGRCSERPPDGVPLDWVLVDLDRLGSMYLPPDMKRVPVQGEDSIAIEFAGATATLDFDIGAYSPQLEDPSADGAARSITHETIHGRTAALGHLQRADGPSCEIRIADIEASRPMTAVRDTFDLWAAWHPSDRKATCDDANRAFRTLWLW